MARMSEPSPYVEFDRKQWRTLRKSTPLVLTEEELTGLRGLGEQIDLEEVAEVYLPLARLIHLQVAARQRLFAATSTFLGETHPENQVPFVIGYQGKAGDAYGGCPIFAGKQVAATGWCSAYNKKA